jgi:hypothetical protein
MRRGVHIAVSFLVVLLLLKPFDCFSSGPFTWKAASCCKKGKCAPSRNSDDCCKGTLPGGKQLVTSKAPQHTTLTLDLVTVGAPAPIAPVLAAVVLIEDGAPPGSPPVSSLNLPLLI